MKISGTTIEIHGREALSLPYRRMATGGAIQADLSAAILYLEIPAAGLRRLLAVAPGDTKAKLLYLSRADVALIPTTQVPYILVDETDSAKPVIELEGTISRTGFTATP